MFTLFVKQQNPTHSSLPPFLLVVKQINFNSTTHAMACALPCLSAFVIRVLNMKYRAVPSYKKKKKNLTILLLKNLIHFEFIFQDPKVKIRCVF